MGFCAAANSRRPPAKNRLGTRVVKESLLLAEGDLHEGSLFQQTPGPGAYRAEFFVR